jgi:hypothetical protein
VTEVWFLLFSCLIIISAQSHVRRVLPVWLLTNATFSKGLIPWRRNYVYEIWMVAHEWFYWILPSQRVELTSTHTGEAKCFPARNLIYCHCPCTNLFQMFSHFAEKTRSWNKGSQTFRDGYIDKYRRLAICS